MKARTIARAIARAKKIAQVKQQARGNTPKRAYDGVFTANVKIPHLFLGYKRQIFAQTITSKSLVIHAQHGLYPCRILP